jgi:hypothetical protein
MNPHQGTPSKPQANQPQTLTQFESFPQPQQPTQKDLHLRLQRNPYRTNGSQQSIAEDLIANNKTANMASTSGVPRELNFITGNKNKLAEVRTFTVSAIQVAPI